MKQKKEEKRSWIVVSFPRTTGRPLLTIYHVLLSQKPTFGSQALGASEALCGGLIRSLELENQRVAVTHSTFSSVFCGIYVRLVAFWDWLHWCDVDFGGSTSCCSARQTCVPVGCTMLRAMIVSCSCLSCQLASILTYKFGKSKVLWCKFLRKLWRV